MNEALKMIDRIRSLGGHLRVSNGLIEIDAPKGVITEEIIEELKRIKPKLLELEFWDFDHLRIPSQIRTGETDVWMVGIRLDRQGMQF